MKNTFRLLFLCAYASGVLSACQRDSGLPGRPPEPVSKRVEKSVRKMMTDLRAAFQKSSQGARKITGTGFKAQDTLVMKNGGMIQGIIEEENAREVVIRLEDGTVGFARSDLAEIRRGQTAVSDQSGIQTVPLEPTEAEGSYPRLYLKNGNIVYGDAVTKEGETFFLKQLLKEGGGVSYGFKIEEIDKIRLIPPAREEDLSREFLLLKKGHMKFAYEKNPYFILSTVDPADSVLYFNALGRLYDDLILHFYDLLDLEKPHGPLGVILFGSYENFLEHARLPKESNIMGYYSPKDRTLRLFNVKEVDLIRRMLAGAEYVEDQLGAIKTKIENADVGVGSNKWQVYDRVEKVGHEIERRRMHLQEYARSLTVEVIRHEATHQLAHLLGLSPPDVYQGAWFSEGLAQFMEPEDYGAVNRSRLMHLKLEADQGHTLMPLQHLMKFRAGTEVHQRMPQDYTLVLYHQSWALVYLLMTRYPGPFAGYIRELKTQGRDFDSAKDIQMLEKHLGKSLAQLDRELEQMVRKLTAEEISEDAFFEFKTLQAPKR